MAAKVKGGYHCNACESVKRRRDFYINRQKSHGLSTYCKRCMSTKINERARAQRRARGLKTDGRGAPVVWTRQRIIESIREWATIYGGPPVSLDWNPSTARAQGSKRLDEIVARFGSRGDWPSNTTVSQKFGTWSAAIKAAGFEPLRQGVTRR